MGTSQSMKEQRLRDAEKAVLTFGATWYASSHRRASVSFEYSDVCTGNGRTMHTVKCVLPTKDSDVEFKESKGNQTREPLILLHGYGGGVGNFYAVLPKLTEKWNGKVYALDAYGCGISSRPACSTIDRVQVENLMVEELELWRKAMGIDRFSVLGHSMGGYIAACYAERYPDRIEVLFLASPAGVPDEPKGWTQSLKEKMGVKASVALYFWKKGWSPFAAVRAADIFGKGKGFIEKYVSRRYDKKTPWSCPKLLVEYIHANFSRSPSAGDYTHAAFLKPGAWAKSPLNQRIPLMKIHKVVFMYGDNDWMNPKHAMDLRDRMKNEQCSMRLIVREIRDAGHNLQIDNPIGFIHHFFDALNAIENRF